METTRLFYIYNYTTGEYYVGSGYFGKMPKLYSNKSSLSNSAIVILDKQWQYRDRQGSICITSPKGQDFWIPFGSGECFVQEAEFVDGVVKMVQEHREDVLDILTRSINRRK